MPTHIMGRKRKKLGRVDHQQHRPIKDDPLTIKSSWFGDETKWVSRQHDDNDDAHGNGASSSSNKNGKGTENVGRPMTANLKNHNSAKDIVEIPASTHQLLKL